LMSGRVLDFFDASLRIKRAFGDPSHLCCNRANREYLNIRG
jgi:hypothetical protein